MGKRWDNFLNWFAGIDDPLEQAVAGMKAQPLVITQGVQPEVSLEKVAHAKWRLDAIKRSVDQHGERLSDRHYDEFRAEIRDHANTLVKAGVITDDDAAALIKHGKGATL